MHVTPRLALGMCLSTLVIASCGRTDGLWWADIASDSGTEATGDGDGDTVGTSTSTTSTSTTTTTDPTATDTTGPDPTDTTSTTTSTSTDTTSTTSTDTACMDVPIDMTIIPAQVIFLLDQGAHMSLQFAGMTRFEAIGEALFAMQTGVVWTWEDTLALGLISYTSNGGNMGGQCPITEIVPTATQNGAAMQLSFAGLNPATDNPTGDAIELAIGLFSGSPGDLVLMTGRNPDSCQNPANNNQAAAATVLAAQTAFAAGITTHVVEVGVLNAGFAQQLANAGAGLDPQGVDTAPYFTPADVGGLASTLDALLASIGSCELLLAAAIPPGVEQACSFTLDGMPIPLDDPDIGWSLPGPDRVRLSPNACQMMNQGGTPSLSCDCEIYQP